MQIVEAQAPSPRKRSRRERLASESDPVEFSCSDNEHDYNEKLVDDININFFYQPRTLTLLICVIGTLIWFALSRDDSQSDTDNYLHGYLCVLILFIPVSLLCFPNGPFIRPHPAMWRIVCGLSCAYQLSLSFALFQKYDDVRNFLVLLYPDLAVASNDSMKAFAENCDLTSHNLYMSCDFFMFAHFSGYVVKAMLIRHCGLLWFVSVMWEITELAFMHVLPNFAECWWDMVILDVLLCNGLGIHLGMEIAKKLEMSSFHWESIKNIRTASGKIRRMILQFTPASWKRIQWSTESPLTRIVAILGLISMFQLNELNFFFFKHIFFIPSSHPLLLTHHFFLVLVSAPAVRQYYMYVTDPNRKRIGTQFWFFIANALTEALFNLRFGKKVLAQLNTTYIIAWMCILVLFSVVAVVTMVLYPTGPEKMKSCISKGRLNGMTGGEGEKASHDDVSGDDEELKPSPYRHALKNGAAPRRRTKT